MKSSARRGDPCVQWVIVIQVRLNQSFEIRLTERQGARAQVFCSHPVCFLTSDSELDLNLCLCFSLSQIPQFIFPVGFCRILKNASFLPSFSIKHIYISWLGVLSEKYFIFFLIALFAFKFLNFHGLHGCVYTSVGWGFFSVACVGSMDIWSPQTVGVIGQALFFFVHVFVLLKTRVVFRK